MARKTKASDIDSNFIINAFRRDDMTIPPEARSTPIETEQELSGEDNEIVISQETNQTQPTVKETAKEETERRRKVVKPDYEKTFVCGTSVTARHGRQVYIRNEYHDRNEISIASYLDNVLAHHFSMFGSDISESFNNHLKSYNI